MKPKRLSGENLNYKIPGSGLCMFLSILKEIAQVQYYTNTSCFLEYVH